MSRGIVKRREGEHGSGLVSSLGNMVLCGRSAFLPWNLSRSHGMFTISGRSRGGDIMTCECRFSAIKVQPAATRA